MARSSGVPHRLRGYESWIDIPSQPSSQSQSPVNSEIVTTGLRVQQASIPPRQQRDTSRTSPINLDTRCTSSQEEYEESESDEDHILTSSSEQIETKSFPVLSSYEVDSDSDRDESNKRPRRRGVDPHDNIDSCLIPNSTSINHSHASRNTFHQHLHRHPADHDAALRASLTTLLSIGAAAARGLPNRESNSTRNFNSRGRQLNEAMGLRFVSESELMAPPQQQLSPSAMKASKESTRHTVFTEKGKRKVSPSEKGKLVRKNQPVSQESMLSSTFLTWAVSAGVLVIISVVGFGAGYVIGREVGRQEALSGLNDSMLGNGSSCGRETMRSSSSGLRRFKWSIGGGSRSILT